MTFVFDRKKKKENTSNIYDVLMLELDKDDIQTDSIG